MKRWVMGLVGVSVCLMAGAAHADCRPLLDAVGRLAKAGDFDGAEREVKRVRDSGFDCRPADNRAAKRIFAAALVNAAEQLRGEPSRRSDLLRRAVQLEVSWKAAQALGRLRMNEKDYAGAAETLQLALNKVAENAEAVAHGEAETETAPTRAELQDLTRRAEEATHLAATMPGGRLVQPPMTRSGAIGGVFNEGTNRDAQAFREPVPILFEFRSDDLTGDGRKAADILAAAMIQLAPDRIVVTGHTDKVGGDEFNMALSLKRARRVADHLKANGVKAAIEVVGKGKTEPRKLSADAGYTEQQIDDLNRRVEFSWK